MRVIIDIVYSNKRRNELSDIDSKHCTVTKQTVDNIIKERYEIIECQLGVNKIGRGDISYIVNFSGDEKELKRFKKYIKKRCDYAVRAVL